MKKLFLAAVLAVFTIPAFADTATVNFSPPTVRTDGTNTQPLDPNDITVYTFYRSANIGGPFDVVQGVVAHPSNTITLTTEANPFYVCFTTTANDPGTTNQQTGPCSAPAEIPATVPVVYPPGAGTIDSVTITFTIP